VIGVGHRYQRELSTLATGLEHVCADVPRDSTKPRLDRSFTAVRRHRAMRAKQRLLDGFIGIGLRAEQRHTGSTKDRTVLSHACSERLAVLSLMEQGNDRIRAKLVGHGRKRTSLHFRPHVRRSGRFVTVEFTKSDKCRGSIAISANRG
jgi:hypothetical protein